MKNKPYFLFGKKIEFKKKLIPEAREKARELIKEAYEVDDVYVPYLSERLHRSGFGLTPLESRKIVEEVLEELKQELE